MNKREFKKYIQTLIAQLLCCITAVMITFKIIGLIKFSWWLVFSPIWIPLLLILCWIFFIFLIGFMAEYDKQINMRKKRYNDAKRRKNN